MEDPGIQSGVYVWSSLEKKLYAFYSFSSGKFNSTKSCWSSFGSSVSTTGSSYSSFSSRATSSTFWRPFCTTWTMRAVIKAGSDSCTLASSSCSYSGTAIKDSAVFSFLWIICSKMFICLLFFYSGERNFGVRLNKPYTATIPMDIPVFTGTHADLLIIVFHKIITTGHQVHQFLNNYIGYYFL